MQTQAIDALLAILDKLSSQNWELERRTRAMERLLSRHNKPIYQEYMNWINDPENRIGQSGRTSFDKLRQALLQDRG